MTGSGPAGELTMADVRKRLASLGQRLAARHAEHLAAAEQAAAGRTERQNPER